MHTDAREERANCKYDPTWLLLSLCGVKVRIGASNEGWTRERVLSTSCRAPPWWKFINIRGEAWRLWTFSPIHLVLRTRDIPRPRDNLTQRRNTSLQLSPHPSVSCRLGGYILGKIWAGQRAKEYFMRKSCPAWTGPTQPNAARKHSLPSCLHNRENKTHQQNKQTNNHTNKTTKATKKGLVQTA